MWRKIGQEGVLLREINVVRVSRRATRPEILHAVKEFSRRAISIMLLRSSVEGCGYQVVSAEMSSYEIDYNSDLAV
jgi:hypothetical protein